MDSTRYIRSGPSGEETIITTVTANPDTVTDWINRANDFYQSSPTVIFGLDIEWKPTWRPGQPANPVATLQICDEYRCLIVQLLHIQHFPDSLDQFLRNARYVFAGVEIGKDVEKLERGYGLAVENVYDVREEALRNTREGRLSQWPGLKELAWEVAGVWLEKPQRVSVSDWSRQVLSEEQIEYACLDAYASCRLGISLYFG